jgi:Na+/H+-dicarboxylate symporter
MSLESSKHHLTLQILIGMGSGVIFGLLIRQLAGILDPSISQYVESLLTGGILELIGKAFLALLKVLVVPLVFVSLVCGTAALNDVRSLGRIGLRTVGLYLMTTAIAISIALIAAIIIRPGHGFELQTEASFTAAAAPGLAEVLIGIFPSNIIAAMAEGNMLQIIVFAILFGLALTVSGSHGQRVLQLFNDLNSVIMSLVWLVMRIAPIGVFALIAKTFATQGFDAFIPLLKYVAVVLAVLFFHALVTYPALLKALSGLPIRPFLSKLREVQIFAFSTASSNATIPVSMRVAENQLGVRNSVASFSIPLGATINMDGTAIMQGVATVFISQAYGLGLEFTDYLMVIVTATLASIGTAGVPGVGLIMLSMVLAQVGLPVEGIGLIIGIDRLLDMVRTAVNVTGDCAVTCIVASKEKAIDQTRYLAQLKNLETNETAEGPSNS